MNVTTNVTAPANCFSLPGAGRVEPILSTTQIYKLEARQTASSLVCLEIAVPPGGGVPPHRHTREDEWFYVLAGRVLFEGDDLGDAPIGLGTGGFFYSPRDRAHGFRCEGPDAAKLLAFISPGAGIEAMFAKLSELTIQYGSTLDFGRVAALAGEYRVTVAPPA